MSRDTAPVRPGEELDVAALRAHLAGVVDGARDGVEVEQFPGGHANLTYLVRAGGAEYVLRRPPPGPVAPKAHDMAREYEVLRRLAPSYPPAPRPLHLCRDTSVIGAVFYLMERRTGEVLLDPTDPGRLVAVLDWEMTTVGDPLVDVGLSLVYWQQLSTPPDARTELGAAGASHGWYTREQFLARYAARSGRHVAGVAWYEVPPRPPASSYDVRARTKAYTTRGICRPSIDGVPAGQPHDQYSATAAYRTVELGRVDVARPTSVVVACEVTGRNAASTGHELSFDTLELRPG